MRGLRSAWVLFGVLMLPKHPHAGVNLCEVLSWTGRTKSSSFELFVASFWSTLCEGMEPGEDGHVKWLPRRSEEYADARDDYISSD